MTPSRYQRAADLTRRLPKKAVADAFRSVGPDAFGALSSALEEEATNELDRLIDQGRQEREQRESRLRSVRRGDAS